MIREAISVTVPDTINPIPQERERFKKAESLLILCYAASYGEYGDCSIALRWHLVCLKTRLES